MSTTATTATATTAIPRRTWRLTIVQDWQRDYANYKAGIVDPDHTKLMLVAQLRNDRFCFANISELLMDAASKGRNWVVTQPSFLKGISMTINDNVLEIADSYNINVEKEEYNGDCRYKFSFDVTPTTVIEPEHQSVPGNYYIIPPSVLRQEYARVNDICASSIVNNLSNAAADDGKNSYTVAADHVEHILSKKSSCINMEVIKNLRGIDGLYIASSTSFEGVKYYTFSFQVPPVLPVLPQLAPAA